jgi:hypothetical protein
MTTAFWDVTLYSLVDHRRFGRSYCLQLHDRRVSQESKQQEAAIADYFHSLHFVSEDGGKMFFRNFEELLLIYKASHPRRQYS